MRWARYVFIGLLSITMLSSAVLAEAWVLGDSWGNSNDVYYTTTTALSAESVTAFGNANIAWNNVAGANKNIYRSGTNTQTDFLQNYQNDVTKTLVGSTGELMRVRKYLNGYGTISEFDLRINTFYNWANSGTSGAYDVQNVATHEIGHALWANDVYFSTQVAPAYTLQYKDVTMYGYAYLGETKKRTLHQDDIDGFSTVY